MEISTCILIIEDTIFPTELMRLDIDHLRRFYVHHHFQEVKWNTKILLLVSVPQFLYLLTEFFVGI